VDVLQGKSVWWRFEPGQLYTLTTQPNADLLLRSEPSKPVYRELLKKLAAELPARANQPATADDPPLTPTTRPSRRREE